MGVRSPKKRTKQQRRLWRQSAAKKAAEEKRLAERKRVNERYKEFMDEARRMAAEVGSRVDLYGFDWREIGRCRTYPLDVLEIEDWVYELREAHENGVEPYHVKYPTRRGW